MECIVPTLLLLCYFSSLGNWPIEAPGCPFFVLSVSAAAGLFFFFKSESTFQVSSLFCFPEFSFVYFLLWHPYVSTWVDSLKLLFSGFREKEWEKERTEMRERESDKSGECLGNKGKRHDEGVCSQVWCASCLGEEGNLLKLDLQQELRR